MACGYVDDGECFGVSRSRARALPGLRVQSPLIMLFCVFAMLMAAQQHFIIADTGILADLVRTDEGGQQEGRVGVEEALAKKGDGGRGSRYFSLYILIY